jgi:hypothetical protein
MHDIPERLGAGAPQVIEININTTRSKRKNAVLCSFYTDCPKPASKTSTTGLTKVSTRQKTKSPKHKLMVQRNGYYRTIRPSQEWWTCQGDWFTEGGPIISIPRRRPDGSTRHKIDYLTPLCLFLFASNPLFLFLAVTSSIHPSHHTVVQGCNLSSKWQADTLGLVHSRKLLKTFWTSSYPNGGNV